MNVDYQSMDWGTAVVRRENKGPIDKGGWSGLFTTLSGLDLQTPSGNAFRVNGENGWFGWADSPRIEALRGDWLDARGSADAAAASPSRSSGNGGSTCRTSRSASGFSQPPGETTCRHGDRVSDLLGIAACLMAGRPRGRSDRAIAVRNGSERR